MSDNPEPLLTVHEVATWLRMSASWVHKHCNRERRPYLPSIKLGGALRFRRQDIEKWLDERLRRVSS